MIGRFRSVSTDRQPSGHSTEDMKTGLSDYVCPECGAQRYHLVFRVEALSHRVTLAIQCEPCGLSTGLLDDHHASGHRSTIQQRSME